MPEPRSLTKNEWLEVVKKLCEVYGTTYEETAGFVETYHGAVWDYPTGFSIGMVGKITDREGYFVYHVAFDANGDLYELDDGGEMKNLFHARYNRNESSPEDEIERVRR